MVRGSSGSITALDGVAHAATLSRADRAYPRPFVGRATDFPQSGTCNGDVGGILALPHRDVADDDQRLHALFIAAWFYRVERGEVLCSVVMV
jgi:hypothetical protein